MSAYYFINRKVSWYPPIEDTIHFNEAKPYLPKEVTLITISKKDEKESQQ